MYDFELARPSTVSDAVAALAAEDAEALGGGQTLIPTLKNRLSNPGKLVSLNGIAELKGISEVGSGVLAVGGATTHAEVAVGAADSFPALASLAANIGDPAVRNRGTIGGSLANNDPAACYPAAVLGTGATVVTNSREIAADEFFSGVFETALEQGEIITSVHFPVPDAANYQKFEQPASRFALVGVFVARLGDTVRVAATGAAEDGVFRWKEAEVALASDFSASSLEGLSVDAQGMIEDIHGSRRYRAHLVSVMASRAVAAAS